MLCGAQALDAAPSFPIHAEHSGKMHQLEAQLAMAKDFAAELRTNLLELEDHCCMLDEVGWVGWAG